MLLCSLIAQTTLVWHPCHRGARNLRRHREDFPQALQVRLSFHLSVLCLACRFRGSGLESDAVSASLYG